MEVNGTNLFTSSHFDQCSKMPLMAVYSAVSKKPHQVQPPFLIPRRSQCIQKGFVVKESAFINVLMDQREVLVNDTTGAKDHVTDFRVTHLTIGQTDVQSGHGKTRGRIITFVRFQVRHAGIRDRIAFSPWIDPESIQNDENDRKDFCQGLRLSAQERGLRMLLRDDVELIDETRIRFRHFDPGRV